MSGIERGVIKLSEERYCEINGERVENGNLANFSRGNQDYFYSELKMNEEEICVVVPYIKYNNDVYFYTMMPDSSITEETINAGLMSGVLFIADKSMIKFFNSYIDRYGDINQVI